MSTTHEKSEYEAAAFSTAVFDIGDHYLTLAIGTCEQGRVRLLHRAERAAKVYRNNIITDPDSLSRLLDDMKREAEETFDLTLDQAYYTTPLLICRPDKFPNKLNGLTGNLQNIGKDLHVNLMPAQGGIGSIGGFLTGHGQNDNDALFIDTNRDSTCVAFLRDGECRQQTMMEKSFVGSATEKLVRKGASENRARLILRKVGRVMPDSENRRFKVCEGGIMDQHELTDLIQRSVDDTFAGLKKIESINKRMRGGMPVYIAGEGAKLPGLTEYLTGFFGTSVLPASPELTMEGSGGNRILARDTRLLCALLQNQAHMYPLRRKRRKKQPGERVTEKMRGLFDIVGRLAHMMSDSENAGKTFDEIDQSHGRETDDQ